MKTNTKWFIAGGLILLGVGVYKVWPRGIRNNNPGNIKKNSIAWKGLATVQDDPLFFKFISPEYGIRAIAKIITTYYTKYGLDTIAGIINRWAPPEENPTQDYIKYVSSETLLKPDDKIDLLKPREMFHLVSAMMEYENGKLAISSNYTENTIQQGINAAMA